MFQTTNIQINDKILTVIKNIYNNKESLPILKGKHKTTIDKSILLSHNILNSLLKNIYSKKLEEKYVLVPLNTHHYAHTENLFFYSYNSAKLTLKILSQYNIIRYEIGSNRTRVYGKPHLGGICTKVYLNNIFEWKLPFQINSFDLFYNLQIPERTNYAMSTLLTLERNGVKKRGRIDDIKTREATFINNYLEQKGYSNLKYLRIFGETTKDFGRFYNSFQFIKKRERQKIYKALNWVELDFKSFNPTICYLLEKKFLPKDPYNKILDQLEIEKKYQDIYRPVIKKTFLALFGCDSRKKALKSIRFQLINDFGLYINKEQILEDFQLKHRKKIFNNYLQSKNFPLDTPHILINDQQLLNIFEQTHQPIQKYFYNSFAKTLQNIESTIIYKLMLEQIKHNILPLSIHDCIIIPLHCLKKFKLLQEFYLYKELLYLYPQLHTNLFPYISKLLHQIKHTPESKHTSYNNNKKIQQPIRVQFRTFLLSDFKESFAPS